MSLIAVFLFWPLMWPMGMFACAEQDSAENRPKVASGLHEARQGTEEEGRREGDLVTLPQKTMDEGEHAEDLFTEEEVRQIIKYKNAIQVDEQLRTLGKINRIEQNERVNWYTGLASGVTNRTVNKDELLLIKDPQTRAVGALDKAIGFLKSVNYFYVLAFILTIACAFVVFPDLFALLSVFFNFIPGIIWEFLWHVGGVALMFGSPFYFSEGTSTYFAFAGCLSFAGSVFFILAHYYDYEVKPPKGILMFLYLVFMVVAIWNRSELIGFLSMITLMGSLGFFVSVHPHMYVIGFENEEVVPRATSSAFWVLYGFVLIRGSGLVPQETQALFESGALFMGALVGYLGMLIMSSNFYEGFTGSWALNNVAMLATCVVGIVTGYALNIPELQKFACTFLVLWALEKPYDIKDADIKYYAWVGLFMGIGVIWAITYVKNHSMEFAREWILFFN